MSQKKLKNKVYKIAILANEESADSLGASLIQQLKATHPNIQFAGIGGAKMCAEGFVSLEDGSALAVMGLMAVLKALPQILMLRQRIFNKIVEYNPDLIIGIDSPSFNLSLERKFKKLGFKVVHYVLPQIWAWRAWRAPKIKEACDMALLLFPFESKICEEYDIAHRFVGYDVNVLEQQNHQSKNAYREQLGICGNEKVVAILPGSRVQEVAYLSQDFLETALFLAQRIDNISFIVPCANARCELEFKKIYQRKAAYKSLKLMITQGKSHAAIIASDSVLCASGTATLECMLLNRPCVVAYKGDYIAKLLVKLLVKVKYCALPNLLANEMIFPEFLQDAVSPYSLGTALLNFLENERDRDFLCQKLAQLQQLVRSEEHSASQVVLKLLKA